MRCLWCAYVALLGLTCSILEVQAASSPNRPLIVLDNQLGPHPVSIYEHEIQTSRPDPLAPMPQLRRLMATIYRPFLDSFTCPPEYQSDIAYMPPEVATALLENLPLGQSTSGTSSTNVFNASSIFGPVRLANCSRPVPSSSPSGSLLLFSPGYGGTHDAYASVLQAAASSGYTVVAIDHTYESAAVVFPDGYVAYTSATTNAYDNSTSGQNFLQAVRIADVVSVLDAIEDGEVPGLGSYARSGRKSVSVSDRDRSSSAACAPLRALMYGHSFGGSTAVNVAFRDSRVIAAANIDGPYYEPVSHGTMRKPVFMMQSSSLPPTAADWPNFYRTNLLGWRTWVRPNNTVHYSFTDLPLLADRLGLRGSLIPEELIGTVNSRRLQEIVWRYTIQFFDYVSKHASPQLLDKPSSDFVDVEVVGHADGMTV